MQLRLLTVTPWILNYGCFVTGLTLLWFETHNWWAMGYAFLASIHITFSVKPNNVAVGLTD